MIANLIPLDNAVEFIYTIIIITRMRTNTEIIIARVQAESYSSVRVSLR